MFIEVSWRRKNQKYTVGGQWGPMNTVERGICRSFKILIYLKAGFVLNKHKTVI